MTRFNTGESVISPGLQALIGSKDAAWSTLEAVLVLNDLLARHTAGDCGDAHADCENANELAISHEGTLVSGSSVQVPSGASVAHTLTTGVCHHTTRLHLETEA